MIVDFCRAFEPEWEKRLLADDHKKRRRAASPCLSELMTLAVLLHQLRIRQFKSFYLLHAQRCLRAEFPGLPRYQRYLELLPCCIARRRVFAGIAARSKSSTGMISRKIVSWLRSSAP